jgi:hypothetical protein
MAKVCVNAILGSYHNRSTVGQCGSPTTLVLKIKESRIFLTGQLQELIRKFPRYFL